MRSRSRIRRIAQWAMIASPLTVAVALSVYSACTAESRVLVAFGYNHGMHLFEPLRSEKATFLSMVFGKAGHMNWDGKGKWLFVEGFCGACGEPWADQGSFVLAKLPGGLAYAAHEPGYNHLTTPRFINKSVLVGCGLAASLALFAVPVAIQSIKRRFMIRPDHCKECDYNLTGNMSGNCSECGTLIPDEQKRVINGT